MIDCHAHLAANEFDDDLDQVINRAKEAGVEAVVVVAQFVDDQQKVLDLAKKYPNFCYPAVGLHPVQVSKYFYVVINLILFILEKPCVS